MKSFPFPILAAAMVAFGCCGVLRADSVRFLPLNEEIAGRELAVQDSKGTQALENLSSGKRSAAFALVAGDEPLRLVAVDRQPPDVNAPSTAIELPKGLKSPLVLILPDDKEATGLRALAIEDSNGSFPWGSMVFINTTGTALVIRYEKEEKPLPGSLAPVQVAAGGESRNMGVQLVREDAPDRVLYSAVWEHHPKVRKLVFVVADEAGENFQLRIIPEDSRDKE